MRSAAVSTLSIGSIACYSTQTTFGARSKHSYVRYRTSKFSRGFTGLKASSSVIFESETSFLGNGSNPLWESFKPKLYRPRLRSSNQPLPQASAYKVAILGAAGGIGQPLALLIKTSPLVSALHLYDIANVKGVAADLSHCNTPSEVLGFIGPSELDNSLKGINSNIVKSLVEAVADNAPDAFIHIISNPVNSTVPIAAEVLKQKGVYDPKKLFGVTNWISGMIIFFYYFLCNHVLIILLFLIVLAAAAGKSFVPFFDV